MALACSPAFVAAPGGDRFVMRFAPRDGAVRGRLVLLQPFAEEANKSRRMLADIARAAASAGWLVVMGDYLGTGDSAGDFGDANWATWVADAAVFAADAGNDELPLVLCGLRVGALVAADAVRGGLNCTALLAINPVLSGKQALTQFLRLGAASDLGQDASARIDTRVFRDRLAAGEAVEIAGYTLSPALAAGMEESEFILGADTGAAGWIEIGAAAGELSPAAARQITKLREAGVVRLETAVLQGPAFWQTQEIEHVASLPAAVVSMLDALTTVPRR